MVRDAIKPDLTMFLHYETLNEDGKQIVAVDIQQGTERPYYIAKKGLRPEGVYVRQGYSSVPATNTAICRMIKETDGDHFEDMRSINQELTFEAAKKQFAQKDLPLGEAQMKTLGIMTHDGVYTNLGLLLSDQCVHTIKVAAFEGTTQSQFKDRKEFSGSLFQQMNEVYDYIDFRNQIHSSFQKLYRIDQRDYPETAVREAYAETGKKPEIETSENVFKIILPNLNVQTGTKKTDINKSAEEGQEEMIISLAKRQGAFTRKEVQEKLGISQSTSGRLLKKMVGNGQIIQEGKGRNTHYRI